MSTKLYHRTRMQISYLDINNKEAKGMNSGIKKKELLDLKTDLKLLLECLDFQKDDGVAVKQSLVTISSILQGSVEAKDVFRDIGGLQQVLTLVTTDDMSAVVETGLYCLGCAVEKNVYSQKLLTTSSVFTLLHGILSSTSKSSVRKKQTASFFVLCLVSNNGHGQNLVRQSSCLHDILSLIRTTLPKDVQDLDSDWFDGMDGKSLNLWCTLLSTTCACVNNPINEGNQRICAALLPYLFSLLTSQSDERILRPVLSHIGLTVSGNESNQDRVRKCGGLEIFVKKLGSLQSKAVCDTDAKVIIIQLLSTIDACISDNECNCKRFGELGGIKLVLALLSECCLDLSEKIQAVLTLAHSLDAYNLNQKYVTECGGVTVLIQQLTETKDEELSKTIKYLLHMCVSSGKGSMSDSESDLTDTERLINKMEAMKRHNDVEMLKKIQELDSKVKSMEDRNQQLNNRQNEKVQLDIGSVFDRLEGCTTSSHPLQYLEAARSHTGSYGEYSGQHDCATPREQSLMEQLIKEKVEKERLEKLNHMLQENICKSQTALSHSRERNQPEKIPISDPQIIADDPQKALFTTADSYRTEKKNCSESDKQNSYSIPTGLRIDQVMPFEFNPNTKDVSPMATRSGFRYQLTTSHGSEYTRSNMCLNNNSLERNKQLEESPTHLEQSAEAGYEKTYKNNENRNITLPLQQDKKGVEQSGNQTENERDTAMFAIPLDLSYCAKKLYTKPAPPNDSVTSKVKTTKASDMIKTQNMHESIRESPFEPKQRTTLNKNAEIQCGTPWIIKANDSHEFFNEKACTSDGITQTNFIKRHATFTDSENNINRRLDKAVDLKQNMKQKKVSPRNLMIRTPVVILTDCESLVSRKSNQHDEQRKHEEVISEHSQLSSFNKNSSGIFAKPTALPPKRKVRVTPLLGSDKLSKARFLQSRNIDKNTSSQGNEYDSDIQSEFDLNLFKNVARQQACVRPTPVIKSQNNVKVVDMMVEKRARNAAEKWQIHPFTPHRLGIVPPRPAFSDCGTRRCVLKSPCSVKSQGSRRRSLDDSGIHSPKDILNISPKSVDGSPVDSNIDEFRSSSDLSDEEEVPPNISAAVLRSSKKISKKCETKCPGCTGFHSTGGCCGGLELNSRTYNIALETDPNTCLKHRKIRQIERVYITKIRKSKRLRSKLKRKIHNQLPLTTSNTKSRAIYEFTSDSADNTSPTSDANEDFRPPKKKKNRRKRIPYTAEEEESLLEGVRTLGKHWNQILVTYDFHPSRTNVDLMDKYKRMRASSSRDMASSKCQSMMSRTRSHKPFSMCEERRLRRGIMKFGYNWKTILNSFTFAQGRTTEDLRNRWRVLHKKM